MNIAIFYWYINKLLSSKLSNNWYTISMIRILSNNHRINVLGCTNNKPILWNNFVPNNNYNYFKQNNDQNVENERGVKRWY